MDVDLPFAARLGVETTDDDKGKKVRNSVKMLQKVYLQVLRWRPRQTLLLQKATEYPTDA